MMKDPTEMIISKSLAGKWLLEIDLEVIGRISVIGKGGREKGLQEVGLAFRKCAGSGNREYT